MDKCHNTGTKYKFGMNTDFVKAFGNDQMNHLFDLY